MILKQESLRFNVQVIEDLSYVHYKLRNLALEVCKNFENTIAVYLVVLFQNMLEYGYFVVLIMARAKLDNIIFWITTLFIHLFCWLLAVVHIFTRVEKEANRTVTLVHDMWNACVKNDVNKKLYLQLVSVRLLSTNLHFTLKGMLKLNWTLCHTVSKQKNSNCYLDTLF